MVTEKTIEIVKSTVPVLEEYGEQITTCFYQLMFESHPELLNIFNHANQKQGRQQRSLAAAVYAAAANIDNLDAIYSNIHLVTHKHRSLGIKPEHYPIVGKYLLLAIKEVLGDAATDDVIHAWTEAYGVIADYYMDIEAKMYEEAESQRGGWDGFRNFVVDKKVVESDVITSFYLRPEDNEEIASYTPGQYISIKLAIKGEKFTHIRQYSLSDVPSKDYYRITVKREVGTSNPDGVVSNYLHGEVREGDVVQISAPAGNFTLDTQKETPIVLLSGGVGITPMMSMLSTLIDIQSKRDIAFIHAAVNGNTHALRDEVNELSRDNVQIFYFYSAPTKEDYQNNYFDVEGFVTTEWLRDNISVTDADFYFCGPVPFMKAMNGALKQLGVESERIHFEFFGPMGDLDTM